mmetsp:Transcript_18059/g.36456  ORF Transcript_18059/g.36456 Transcript_18059/m.36456 type:complete len:182 (+) Transcript_18059:548-1093(+)
MRKLHLARGGILIYYNYVISEGLMREDSCSLKGFSDVLRGIEGQREPFAPPESFEPGEGAMEKNYVAERAKLEREERRRNRKLFEKHGFNFDFDEAGTPVPCSEQSQAYTGISPGEKMFKNPLSSVPFPPHFSSPSTSTTAAGFTPPCPFPSLSNTAHQSSSLASILHPQDPHPLPPFPPP